MSVTIESVRTLLADAATLEIDTLASQMMARIFTKLLVCEDAAAGQLAVDILHGKHGRIASRAAWKVIRVGINPLDANGVDRHGQGQPRFSLAAICVLRRTTHIFEALIQAGAPAVVSSDLKPGSLSEWMDVLASTDIKRASLKVDAVAGQEPMSHGVVGEIASYGDTFPKSAIEALEIAWRVDPHHRGFDAMMPEQSEGGALVRAFRMNKGIACVGEELAGPAAPRRRACV